ncbi:hypothetical protein BGW38_000712 [Lunasporangiospora selenospora]|uniref:Nucleolar 27S pre-rRNA processing Urb2/Npa2 C-terminal domain-containing protein n=1 Tax=Lunasporangiospora selenospora TaxID=979761 RepID=A0A9P6FV47_9FUNG|nr:hypothetical protein BGW38_000712 [Lunasporangiospora selenospora]
MESNQGSSELFAKALKGIQTPPAEKIRLARQAWENEIVFPHKQEFILDWLCNALVKSTTTRTKNSKDNTPNVILDLEYWRLLKDILRDIAPGGSGSFITSQKRKSTRVGGSSSDRQASSIFLRLSVIPIFIAIVQEQSSQLSAVTAASSSDSGFMGLLETTSACFDILSGPAYAEWFQPTLEQYAPLAQSTLETLAVMNEKTWRDGNDSNSAFLRFASSILDRFRRLIAAQPNQRKVFTLITGKMFETLVDAHFTIRHLHSATTTNCLETMGAILRLGLFHREHLHEYTAGYTAGEEKDVQSYQKLLFDQISTLVQSDHRDADILPTLLRYYVEECRKKQRSMAGSGQHRGADHSKETEFSFFKIIYTLSRKQLPSLSKASKATSITHLCKVMESHNSLLSALLDLNMYQPSNNQDGDQFVFMATSFGSIHSCLEAARDRSDDELERVSLNGVIVLARLDDRLIKPQLDSLWPVLLTPLQGAAGAALELAQTLLEIYSRSSEFKPFLSSLLKTLHKYSKKTDQLDLSPIFSRPFLDLIRTSVRNFLPQPQTPGILDMFLTELLELGGEGLDISQDRGDQNSVKKRKLNSKRSKEEIQPSDIPSTELVVIIFIHFLKGLRIATTQEKQLNETFHTLYNGFTKPALEKASRLDSDGQLTEQLQRQQLLPALRLHYALCRISTHYWSTGLTLDDVSRIAKMIQSLKRVDDATALVVNQVLLQHVHMVMYTSTLDEALTQRLKDLVHFTMELSRLEQLRTGQASSKAVWNGELKAVKGDAFLVASWQIQANDWLDVVCRFGSSKDMELIAEIITNQFQSPTESPSTTSIDISIGSLNLTLLRSANFYEVPNFRPIFSQKILSGIGYIIQKMSETPLEKKLAKAILSFTDPNAKELKATYSDILKELSDIIRQKPTSTSTKPKAAKPKTNVSGGHVEQLLALLSVIHLLPLEYFERLERNIILTTMFVLDYYIRKYLNAGSTELKCLLLGRRVSTTIMRWRNDAGVMTTSSMAEHAVKYFMVQTQNSVHYLTAYEHLEAVLGAAMPWTKSSLKDCHVSLNGHLDQPRTETVLLSRVCQALHQSIEQIARQHSKQKSMPAMSAKFDHLCKEIETLFDIVYAETTRRIQSVLSFMNKGQTEKAIDVAVQSSDHFELYSAIVLYYRQRNKEKQTQCLKLMPELFGLAQSLLKSLDNNGDSENVLRKTSLLHLITLLTSYSCEYWTLLPSWSQPGASDTPLTELLDLVMDVSGLDQEASQSVKLKEAYITMLGNLSEEHFEQTLQWLLDSERLVATGGPMELVLVRYLGLTFLNSRHVHRRQIRRQISRLLTRLTQITGSSTSVDVIVGGLDIIAGICSESFDIRTWELGLALEAINTLMSPSTPLLLRSSKDTQDLTNGQSVASCDRLLIQDTSRIFTAVYHVLNNMARFRQEELTTLIPIFTSILQGIFHGFKSLHASIAKRQQGVETLLKSPFMLLSAGSNKSTSSSIVGDPLPVECAENFARLLTALGSKGVSPLGNYGGGGSGQQGASAGAVEGVQASSSSMAVLTDASKAFGKHVPYILMEYFTIQSSVVASINQQSLRNALLPGLYSLLNLCSEYERQVMMAGLDNTGKMLLKGLYADYLKYHKYTGR